ncbi:MAG: 3-deoxy-7-phosphoheptulonate synthase [Deltaproteobacteria bacterium]|nr:3-deoxy-7-phosphoheptulonate synthase [Deltaproteobacteria bacterium]
MKRTSNLNVRSLTPIIAPAELRQVFPLCEAAADFVTQARYRVRAVLRHLDPRVMVVVGPCSIHDPEAAVEYARRLARLGRELEEQLLLVMRVYFEKPRTTLGWKGLINDPDLNGTNEISKGLGVARRLLCAITDLGLPVASELLDPITPQYLADLLTWGAIGARTTESQPHREMASGLSFPVGFKNGTDGDLQVAVDAMAAARQPHSFLGIDDHGRTAVVRTKGNADVHIVLRGGRDAPNYSAADVVRTEALMAKSGLNPAIMIDCSHANSFKDHDRQEEVLTDVVEQIARGNRSIFGLMLESNLEAGNQPLGDDPARLRYGVSVTDKCIDWPTTERLLGQAAERLAKSGGRRVH